MKKVVVLFVLSLVTMAMSTSPASFPDNSELISITERHFYKSVSDYDKENREHNAGDFKRVFSKRRIKPYDLYVELIAARKKAEKEAADCCTAKRANGEMRYLYNYYSILEKSKDTSVNMILNKYGLTRRQLLIFQHNYCFCYRGKAASYCKEGVCQLKDGEFWK